MTAVPVDPAEPWFQPGALLGDQAITDALQAVHSRLHSVKAVTLNDLVSLTTMTYLDGLDPEDPPHASVLEQQLLSTTNQALKMYNDSGVSKAESHALHKTLTNWQIAQILLRLHHVVRIAPDVKQTDREYDLLAMYNFDGQRYGTYTTSEDDIRTVARGYNASLALKAFDEVRAILREASQRTHQLTHRDLIAVNNGIFHYGTERLSILIEGKRFNFEPKSLNPFDPSLIFLAKSHINYVESPTKVTITHPIDGTEWDIESWMRELSDDEGVPELLWEIVGAIIRPHVRWGKTAWFYSEAGNNGKGTLCALMRNLVGPGTHTSIPLSDFGKDFALEPLVRANAIIVDENDVGGFIDKAANLKAIVTNDVIQINRKHRIPIAYQFFGFMVQCLNEFPRMRDKSDSNYRRQLFVPFRKSFEGIERKYIKDDYLQRTDVLEYALWYVLNVAGSSRPGSYYRLSTPEATQTVLDEYKEANDPVRAFWEEFREKFVWDLLPFTFAYDAFRAWHAETTPGGSPVGQRQFVNDLVSVVRTDEMWFCRDKTQKVRPGQLMNQPEPLIAEYDLKKWMNPNYTGTDPLKRSRPALQASYRGLHRQTVVASSGDDEETCTTD